MKQPLIQHLNQLATDRWARQGVRTLLRAAWLGASIWCIGLGGHLLWGWSLRPGLLEALALGMVGQVFARELVGPRHSEIAGALQRLDVGSRDRLGSPRPERVDERQPRQPEPGLAQIDLLHGIGDARQATVG